jgi:hypothetical protein
MSARSLTEHQGICTMVTMQCPNMNEHVDESHKNEVGKLLVAAWGLNAVLQSQVESSTSEQRLAATPEKPWVFNWPAAFGWGGGRFECDALDPQRARHDSP